MTESNSTTPEQPPTKIITLTRSSPDYLKSENLSRHLVRKIMAYYARDNQTPRVWLEKQRLASDFVWVVRSNITMTVPSV
jgi:hypothetical protein